MDTSEHDQSGSDWMIAHHLKHQISGATAGTPDSSISASQAIPVNSYPCRSILMLDSFIPMASNENNTPRKANSINCTPTAKPVAVSSRGLFLPTIPTILTPSPSHSPNDFSGMIHSTVPCPSMTPCSNVSKDFIGTRLQKIVLNIPETRGASVFHHHESRSESSIKNYTNKESSSNMLPVNDPCRTNVTEGSQEININSAEASDYLCPIDLGEMKRKKADPDREICNRVHTKEKRSRKTINQHFKDHLNARARSRQAANSHNIAERLRRERISERYRYLQNLVPGCTKVTGKALMLDEIINYVQSLQQQVEFLSMKLAAVYPPENYTIGWLHAKVLHARDDTSLETGLPQEMFHPDLHPSQQDFAPISVSSMIHSSWDQELNDIMDIADGTNAQEISSMVPLCRDTTLLS